MESSFTKTDLKEENLSSEEDIYAQVRSEGIEMEDSRSSSMIEYRDKMLDANAGGIDDTSQDMDSKLTDTHASLESAPIIVKAKRAKQSQKNGKRIRQRKLVYTWPCQSEVSALIAAVRKRPQLWDGRCSEYRLGTIKLDFWQQVACELGIPEVNAFEARNKWNVIRSLFKANLVKYRAKKSGQPSSDTVTVPWTHFSEIMFIESGEVAPSSSSTSTMALEGAFPDTSIVNDLSQPSTFRSSHIQTGVEQNNDTNASKRKKPSKSVTKTTQTQTPTSTSTPASSPAQCGCLKDLASEVLTSLHSRPSQGDRLTTFGELIERNLRSLPVNESLHLEGQIMHLMYTFLSTRTDPLQTYDSIEVKKLEHNGELV